MKPTRVSPQLLSCIDFFDGPVATNVKGRIWRLYEEIYTRIYLSCGEPIIHSAAYPREIRGVSEDE